MSTKEKESSVSKKGTWAETEEKEIGELDSLIEKYRYTDPRLVHFLSELRTDKQHLVTVFELDRKRQERLKNGSV